MTGSALELRERLCVEFLIGVRVTSQKENGRRPAGLATFCKAMLMQVKEDA